MEKGVLNISEVDWNGINPPLGRDAKNDCVSQKSVATESRSVEYGTSLPRSFLA